MMIYYLQIVNDNFNLIWDVCNNKKIIFFYYTKFNRNKPLNILNYHLYVNKVI